MLLTIEHIKSEVLESLNENDSILLTETELDQLATEIADKISNLLTNRSESVESLFNGDRYEQYEAVIVDKLIDPSFEDLDDKSPY